MRTIVALLLVALPLRADVIDDLLALPPVPRVSAQGHEPEKTIVPDASSPLLELVHYWSRGIPDLQPPDAIRERLVEAIEKAPDFVPLLVTYFPVRESVCTSLSGFEQQENVARWMLHHCASHRARLVAAASRAAEGDEYIDGDGEMTALVRADWKTAEPILQRFASSKEPRLRAAAFALLYEHDPDAERRAALQGIAADATAPGRARYSAFNALGKVPWDGIEEWLFARMRDPSLIEVTDGHVVYSPIAEVVAADPDRWIPVMTRLLSSDSGTVRTLAAGALGQYHLDDARADALAPLIPWISDPNWAGDGTFSDTRLRLVQSVAKLGLREAVPHLRHAAASDPDETIRTYAALELADFGEGKEAIRAALRLSSGGMEGFQVAEALVKVGGLTAEELARGMAAWVGHRASQPKDSVDLMLGNGVTGDALIGMYIETKQYQDEEVAALVVAHAAKLEQSQPQTAKALIESILWWRVPTVQALRMRRIEQGTADARMIAAALVQRSLFQDRPALRRLEAPGGIRAGIAAALSGDVEAVLSGNDREAQRALLAATRLAGVPLPLGKVETLFGHTPGLDKAAEAWLIADDSTEARALVQKRHPGKILILGLRSSSDPGHDTFGPFDKWERDLLRRFEKSGADEVLALASAGYWSPLRSIAEITIRDGVATFERDGRNITLDAAAIAELRRFLEETKFDELSFLENGVHDGIQYEYVHLTRTGGRRVYMNNPAFGPPIVYAELVRKLEALVR